MRNKKNKEHQKSLDCGLRIKLYLEKIICCPKLNARNKMQPERETPVHIWGKKKCS